MEFQTKIFKRSPACDIADQDFPVYQRMGGTVSLAMLLYIMLQKILFEFRNAFP